MDTILAVFIGFAAGGFLGAREGTGSNEELRESGKVISTSEDFKAIRDGAPTITMAVSKQCVGGIAGMSSHE